MQRGDANRKYRLGHTFLLDPILWMNLRLQNVSFARHESNLKF